MANVGLRGNEEVDGLAKQARRRDHSDLQVQSSKPELKVEVWSEAVEERQGSKSELKVVVWPKVTGNRDKGANARSR